MAASLRVVRLCGRPFPAGRKWLPRKKGVRRIEVFFVRVMGKVLAFCCGKVVVRGRCSLCGCSWGRRGGFDVLSSRRVEPAQLPPSGRSPT